MQKTKIEWTDTTWNPITGCSRVSEGCRNCYAERFAHRFSGNGQRYEGLTKITNGHPSWTGDIQFSEKALLAPITWRKPRRVFVNSMSDLFHPNVTDEQIDKIFAMMALTQQHTYQVLTKRPERMLSYMEMVLGEKDMNRWQNAAAEFPIEYKDGNTADCVIANSEFPLPNVWLGVSVEDQDAANKRIPLLLKTPAQVRFISGEPLLGPVDIKRFLPHRLPDDPPQWKRMGLDWVIVGGESGPGARPMHPDWVNEILEQCVTVSVPFFFKQWGNWMNAGCDAFGKIKGQVRHINSDGSFWNEDELPDDDEADVLTVVRVDKKIAGAKFHGREWKQFPEKVSQ